MKIITTFRIGKLFITTIVATAINASAGIIVVDDVQTYQGDGTISYNPPGTSTSGGVTSFGAVPTSAVQLVDNVTSGTFVFTGRNTGQLSNQNGLFNGSNEILVTSEFTVTGGSADIFSSSSSSIRFDLRNLAGVTEIRLNVTFSEPITNSFSNGNPLPGNSNPLGLAFSELTPGVNNGNLGAIGVYNYNNVQHTSSFASGDPVFSPGVSATTPNILLMGSTEVAGFSQISQTSIQVRGGGGYQGIHGWDDGNGSIAPPTDLDNVIDEGETNYITGLELILTPGNGDTEFNADTNFLMSFAGGQFNFIPEPSSAFLSLIGSTLFLLQRKRRS